LLAALRAGESRNRSRERAGGSVSARPSVIAWHFLPTDGCMRYGDSRKVVVGETYRITEEPIPCQHGFHGSVKALDALRYAPGPVVCRVRLAGKMVEHDGDKIAAQQRTAVQMADATDTLRLFACWVAERALKAERKAGREPDPRSWNAIKVTRDFVNGTATAQEQGAAWSAAGSAAESAAWSAARSAARSAAWGAEHKWQRAALDKRLRIALKGRAR